MPFSGWGLISGANKECISKHNYLPHRPPIGRIRANKAGPKKILFSGAISNHFRAREAISSHFCAANCKFWCPVAKKGLSGLREQRANRKKVFSAATPAGLRPEQQANKQVTFQLFIFSEAKSQSEQEQQTKKKFISFQRYSMGYPCVLTSASGSDTNTKHHRSRCAGSSCLHPIGRKDRRVNGRTQWVSLSEDCEFSSLHH